VISLAQLPYDLTSSASNLQTADFVMRGRFFKLESSTVGLAFLSTAVAAVAEADVVV
jgi:hypothetical protein